MKIKINEVETEVHSVINTQEEYDKIVQSATSKAKNELLKELGVNGVEDAKQKMSLGSTNLDKVNTLTDKVALLEEENELTRNKLFANELKVKPELVDKVIILAKAQKTDDVSMKDLIKREAEAINAIAVDTPPKKPETTTKRLGSEKTLSQDGTEKEALAKYMEKLRKLGGKNR